jgi:hypothetical protein
LKRKRNDEAPINTSSSSVSISSSSKHHDYITAEIDAVTANYLAELRAKRAQAAVTNAAQLDDIKQQAHDLAVKRQQEALRHEQKLAETEQEENKLIEKMDNEILRKKRAEVAAKALEERQKTIAWNAQREREDYAEQQKRDAQEWEDARQRKLAAEKKRTEREDARLLFEQQQILQQRDYDRDLNKTIVLDSLRKGKVGEGNTRHMLKSIFTDEQEGGKAPQKGEEDLSENEGSSANPYKPYHPFGDST